MIPTGSTRMVVEPADVVSVGSPAEAERAIGAVALVKETLERLAQTVPMPYETFEELFERDTGMRLRRGRAGSVRRVKLPSDVIEYVEDVVLFAGGVVAKVDEVWLHPRDSKPLLIHLNVKSVEVVE